MVNRAKSMEVDGVQRQGKHKQDVAKKGAGSGKVARGASSGKAAKKEAKMNERKQKKIFNFTWTISVYY